MAYRPHKLESSELRRWIGIIFDDIKNIFSLMRHAAKSDEKVIYLAIRTQIQNLLTLILDPDLQTYSIQSLLNYSKHYPSQFGKDALIGLEQLNDALTASELIEELRKWRGTYHAHVNLKQLLKAEDPLVERYNLPSAGVELSHDISLNALITLLLLKIGEVMMKVEAHHEQSERK